MRKMIAALAAAVGLFVAPAVSAQTVTMGETAVLSAADNGNGNLLLAQEATLSSAGTLQSLSFYTTNAKAAGNLILGVYNVNASGMPGTMLAQTASFAPKKGWNVAVTTTQPMLQPGNYYLAYWPSSSALAFRKENNSGSCYMQSLKWKATMPTTFASTGNCTPTNWSFYATLNTVAVAPTLALTDNPASPSVLANAATGTVVTTLAPAWSNGSAFTGALALTNNDGSMFGLSGNQVVVSGNLSSLGGTTQQVTAEAVQGATVVPLTVSIAVAAVTTNPPPPPPPPPTQGSDPTTGLIPASSDGYANWSTAGLMSVGGIPNRTTIYQTIAPSGGDDTAALNAALGSCPANEVVQLTAGVFKISGNGINLTSPYCTLRGAGPGQQLSTGLNQVAGGGTVRACTSGTLTTYGDASFCTDSTATQLVKTDRASNPNYQVLSVNPAALNQTGYGSPTGNSYNLSVDAVQGAYSVTLTATPNPAINVGDIVLIDENTDNDANVVYGPSFGGPGDGSRRWFSRQDRSLSQLVEVSAVSGATITFDTPITYPFHTANAAQLTTYTGGSFLHYAGVENLFVFGGMGGDGHGNIAIANCAYCWVKNVEAMWSNGSSIGFYSTFRNVLRDSYIHESDNPNPGGGGYLTTITNGGSENLIENNILWNGNKVDTMRASGGGNVFAYNYTDDAFDQTNPEQPEAGANAGHYTTPHLELLEGNYSHNYKGDTYWGNSIFITSFRNQFSGLRAAHAPLNTFTYALGCGPLPYGDYSGRTAVDVQAYSFDNNFVGNVLGFKGQTLLNYPSTACFDGQEQAFLLQVSTTAAWNASGNADDVPMWQFGAYQATVNTTGNWSFVDSTISTQTLNGNWDWVSGAQHWYGTGGFTDGSVQPVALPTSFYLTSEPAFFGTQTWPWVDPTTGTTYTLPAMYCFQHGLMPTCLQ